MSDPEEEGAGGEGASPEGEDESPARRSLVFLGSGVDEERAVQLGEALDCELRIVDPLKLCAEDLESPVAGVIVLWDLGGLSALDVVESLSRGPLAGEHPVVVACGEPTRSTVRAALRAGAAGIALDAYDAEELRRWLPCPPGATTEG